MDNLIRQNPRDSLILLRDKNLIIEKKNRAAKAEVGYSDTLRMFSGQFLRANVFESLSELQKKELDKLCASFCRRRIVLNSLPFLGSLGGIFALSFSEPISLLLLMPWVIVSVIAIGFMAGYFHKKKKVFFLDQISFLFARRKIKKAEKLTPPKD